MNRMPRNAAEKFDEGDLTKGQLRKLNALRKSVGEKIGEKAFADWLASQPAAESAPADKNAELIVNTLGKLVDQKKLRIPRGGYLLKRGRGRVIGTRAKTD